MIAVEILLGIAACWALAGHFLFVRRDVSPDASLSLFALILALGFLGLLLK